MGSYRWPCGGSLRRECPKGLCCSGNSTCGNTAHECLLGCQPDYGLCGLENVALENETCTAHRPCVDASLCCTYFGYSCGRTIAFHCGAGCLSGPCFLHKPLIPKGNSGGNHVLEGPNTSSSSLAPGPIVGIACGSVGFVLFLIALLYVCWRKRSIKSPAPIRDSEASASRDQENSVNSIDGEELTAKV